MLTYEDLNEARKSLNKEEVPLLYTMVVSSRNFDILYKQAKLKPGTKVVSRIRGQQKKYKTLFITEYIEIVNEDCLKYQGHTIIKSQELLCHHLS